MMQVMFMDSLTLSSPSLLIDFELTRSHFGLRTNVPCRLCHKHKLYGKTSTRQAWVSNAARNIFP